MEKSRSSRFGRFLTALAMLSAISVGCASADNGGSGAAVTEPPAQQPTTSQEAMSVEVDDLTSAQATTLANGHYFVRIARKDGTPQIEADFAPPADGKMAVKYTFHPPATGDNPAPNAESAQVDLDIGADEKPTLEDALNGTVFLNTQVTHATVNEYDSYGCDVLPGRFNGIVSCGPKGKCCDIHDACYKKYHCTSGSWKSAPWSKCQLFCNIPAVSCFTSPLPVGPSSCCFQGNCGKPR